MEKLSQTISRARQAAELRRHLEPFMQSLISNYTDQWINGKTTPEEREDIHRKVVLLFDLMGEIEKVVQEGVVAEEIVKMKRVSRDAD